MIEIGAIGIGGSGLGWQSAAYGDMRLTAVRRNMAAAEEPSLLPSVVPEAGTAAIAVGMPEYVPQLPAMLGAAPDAAETLARMRIQYPGGEDEAAVPGMEPAKSPAQAMEETECQTCKERKYQDGSDDPGVSFKTPTSIDADAAASAVRGHEMEHVVRERAKAQREGRKVVSQSVSIHTEICPECGRVYISGGTTRTVTAADPKPEAPEAPDNPRKDAEPAAA